MAVTPSPFGPKPAFFDAAGAPDLSYKLFFYAAGSNTKQNTYTDSTGVTPNANPLILNSLGQPSTEIWFTVGQFYKAVLAPSTDTDPPTSPVWTIDNIQGMGTITTATAQDEWVLSSQSPTFISATSFSVPGNQTATYQVNRRVKTANTGGTVYSTVISSAFGAVTTVTVINDSGTLDIGLSQVSYGLLSATNPAMAKIIEAEIKAVSATVAANALTVSVNYGVLNFRSTTLTSGATNLRNVGATVSVVVPNTATLGTVNAQQARLAILAIDNGGTVEAAVINLAGGTNLDESGVISTTAVSAAATSSSVAYSTTARASVPYRVVGFLDITEATAGTWATAPTLVQGVGGEALTALSAIGYGQTWVDVTASRALTTTYYNTTGKPIMVVVNMNLPIGASAQGIVAGQSVSIIGAPTAAANLPITVIVPPGQSYSIGTVGGAPVIGTWREMR